VDTAAERGKAATLDAEVQERTVQHLDPTAASGAWLLQARLAISDRHDALGLYGDRTKGGDAKRYRLPRRRNAVETPVGQSVLPTVSRAVSLKNEPRQGFKAYCLGHCLTRCLACSTSVSVSHPLIGGTARHAGNNSSIIE
jgi:hypothetical protein